MPEFTPAFDQGANEPEKIHPSQEHADFVEKSHFKEGERKPNYNDNPDSGVQATVERLVDTSKVIELEQIDFDSLPKKYGYRFIKRAFDIVSCSIALVLCAIPMGIIAIKIKKDSPGPVFYRQERLGLNGKPITIVKFRSMYIDAEAHGAQWAEGDDPRVTPLGKKLRRTRLDELPQFVAVVKGDLSLIGPRPERKVFYDEFEKYIHGFSQRMMVRPGITGHAQVHGGYDLLPEEKVIYDLDYIKNCSVSMDWGIIWKTFSVLFTHKGAR
ncbi:MAG: sugar transferase [Coriobacteriia bacterium]|nr:sugar transferase [Coriobacteriia bacterium]